MRNTYDLSRPNGASLMLGLFGLGLVLIALFGPAVEQPGHYHAFADQRALLGIPHAMDVLSNLPFLLLGLYGLTRLPQRSEPRWRALRLSMSLGLLLTFLGSSAYHLTPADTGLIYDRLGMLVLFSAILGMAIADRLDFRTAGIALTAILLGGAASLWAWWVHDNLLSWIVLQAGGMLLLVLLACCRPLPDGYGFKLGACVTWYALAKLAELGDDSLFHLSGEFLSGHTVKHLLASLAVLPLLLPLARSGAIASGATGRHRRSTALPADA